MQYFRPIYQIRWVRIPPPPYKNGLTNVRPVFILCIEDNKCKFLFILIRTVHIGIISKNFYFIFLIIIKKVLLHLHTYYNFFKINFKTFSFELAI